MSDRDIYQPPPAFGAPVGPYESAIPHSTAPRISDWLSEAFNLFTQEWKVWLGQGLIFILLVYGPMMLGYFAFYGVAIFAGLSSPSGSSGSGSSQPPSWVLPSMFGTMGLMLLGILAGSLLAVWLSAGMKRTAAKQLRGEPIRVGDVWSGADSILPLIGFGFLYSLCIFAGFFVFIIGAYLVMALLFFAQPLIVEGRLGVIDAMRKSWETVRPHMWMYLLFVFIIALLASVGAQFCIVGAAATLPIYFLAMMVAYRDAIGIPGALPPQISRPQTGVRQAAPPVHVVSYGPAGAPVAGPPCPRCGRALAVGAVVCPACQNPVPPGYADQRPA